MAREAAGAIAALRFPSVGGQSVSFVHRRLPFLVAPCLGDLVTKHHCIMGSVLCKQNLKNFLQSVTMGSAILRYAEKKKAPIKPQGNKKIPRFDGRVEEKWRPGTDSNRRVTGLQPAAFATQPPGLEGGTAARSLTLGLADADYSRRWANHLTRDKRSANTCPAPTAILSDVPTCCCSKKCPAVRASKNHSAHVCASIRVSIPVAI